LYTARYPNISLPDRNTGKIITEILSWEKSDLHFHNYFNSFSINGVAGAFSCYRETAILEFIPLWCRKGAAGMLICGFTWIELIQLYRY